MDKLPPLADLHRHLDGSLRWSTLLELADRQGVQVPADVADVQFFEGMGLNEALARFAITLSVLQHPEAVERVASEMCLDSLEEGVNTLEIRFAPQLHLGAPIEEIVDAAISGVGDRARLILCGLYGEAPATLDRLVEVATTRPQVVGIDLAGGPSPQHKFTLEDYAGAFTAAREKNLGRTVHAGEGRPAHEIRQAIEILHAQRIGHGSTILEDPEVLALVLAKDVAIEACPTSNVHTGIIQSVQEHPIAQWLREGITVCVCADNTLLSNTNALQELEGVMDIPEISHQDVLRVIKNGHDRAFPSR